MRNRRRAGPGRPTRSLAVAVFFCGCAGEAERQVSLEAGDVEFDRPTPSGEPYLSVGAGGRAILTWIEPEEGVPALRLAIRGEDGWSEPRPCGRRKRCS